MTRKMEWVNTEEINLSGLSLKEAKTLLDNLSNKYGDEAKINIENIREEHYSPREEKPYISTRSKCHIQTEKPVLSTKEKKKKQEHEAKEDAKMAKKVLKEMIQRLENMFHHEYEKRGEKPPVIKKKKEVKSKGIHFKEL